MVDGVAEQQLRQTATLITAMAAIMMTTDIAMVSRTNEMIES